MSGGIAYIFDEKGEFPPNCNKEMAIMEALSDPAEIEDVKAMIQRHADYTQSAVAQRVLANWSTALPKFVKVISKDYKRVLQAFDEVQRNGLTGDQAIMAAFELNKNDPARVTGN
jgi:glutamate synthase (ferredoxin)